MLIRVQEEPMMNRVWCYQERVLARRTIHFTSHEMYWECEVGLLEETAAALVSSIRYTEYCITDLAKGLTNRKDFGWVGTPPEFEFREHRAWYDVVLEYTSRNLTYQKDKLPALSGVIAAMCVTLAFGVAGFFLGCSGEYKTPTTNTHMCRRHQKSLLNGERPRGHLLPSKALPRTTCCQNMLSCVESY
jgi:hypothetical protein